MQSTAKVFEEDIKATPVTNIGSVQHVTEKPGFGLSVDQSPSRPKGNLPLVGLFNENDLDDDDQEDANPTGLVGRIQQRIAAKKNFQQDFKARLKSRFDRFKQKQEQAEDTNVGRGSVSPISLNRSSFGRSFSGSRNRGQSSSEFRSRSSAEITTEQADLVSEPSELQPVSSRAPRQRFRSRIRGSPSRIFLKHRKKDFIELVRVGRRDPGRGQLADSLGQFVFVAVLRFEWCFAGAEGVDRAPECPHICLSSVVGSSDHLRREIHPHTAP